MCNVYIYNIFIIVNPDEMHSKYISFGNNAENRQMVPQACSIREVNMELIQILL